MLQHFPPMVAFKTRLSWTPLKNEFATYRVYLMIVYLGMGLFFLFWCLLMCRKTLSQHRPAIGLLLFAASRLCKTIIKHGKKFPFRSGRRKKELGSLEEEQDPVLFQSVTKRYWRQINTPYNLICFYKEKSFYLFEHPFLRTRGLGSRLDAFILILLKKVRSFEIAILFQFLKIPEA